MQLAYTKISYGKLCNLHKSKTRRAAVASAPPTLQSLWNMRKQKADFSALVLFFNALCAEAMQEDRHATLFRFLAGKAGTGDITILVGAFQQGTFHAQVILNHIVHSVTPVLWS